MIRFEENRIMLDADRCVYCGSGNIVLQGNIAVCNNCGERFSLVYEFENPERCICCGYFGDCFERFSFCPFDGRRVDEKFIECWKQNEL